MATASYKCPNCGGSLTFDPDIQKSRCDYCLSEFTAKELEDKSQVEERAEKTRHEHLKAYNCNNCGAEVVTDETTSATFCYYCHSPVLLTDRLTGDFQPSRIIPFQYDRDDATGAFLKWARRKKFVPKSFYSASQLEKMTGLYIPHWMADVSADVDFAGKGVNLRTWRSGNTEYTEHKEFAFARHGKVDVNNIHEPALKKLDKPLVDSITPYDEQGTLDFSMTYLSGFFAEKYDIEQEQVQPVVEQRARESVRNLVMQSIGQYDRVELNRDRIDMQIKGWHYALLPAWILTYLFKGKTYVYAVNGQTGKSHGELPIDKPKLLLTAVLAALAVLALLLAGGTFVW